MEKMVLPVIGWMIPGGAREIPGGVNSLGGYADICYRNTRAVHEWFLQNSGHSWGPCGWWGRLFLPRFTGHSFFMVERILPICSTWLARMSFQNCGAESYGQGVRRCNLPHSIKSLWVTHFFLCHMISMIPNTFKNKPLKLPSAKNLRRNNRAPEIRFTRDSRRWRFRQKHLGTSLIPGETPNHPYWTFEIAN